MAFLSETKNSQFPLSCNLMKYLLKYVTDGILLRKKETKVEFRLMYDIKNK